MAALTPHAPVRPEWLALRTEAALDPAMPIVDAHHHLWDRLHGQRYLFDELLADMTGGHDIRATVFVQSRSMYRQDLPDAFRPVGEVEFANGVAARAASGLYGRRHACAGISTTNLAFGGPDGHDLFMTESQTGSILRARLDVAGAPMFSHQD